MPKILLSTAYLPNIQYFRAITNNSEVEIEQWESFAKQTYRNRCEILAESGRMSLTIPVCKACSKQYTKDIQISYSENWQAKHWHAIVSAYNSAPFFMYFRDDIEPFFHEKTKFLLDFNIKIYDTIANIIGVDTKMTLSDDYRRIDHSLEDCCDLRDIINPKVTQNPNQYFYSVNPYPQVFDSKHSFIPNLSIIDALFNLGTETIDILKN